MQSKIFGIGLSKTGTSSLAQALQRLGYSTKDCMGAARYLPGDLSSLDMDTVLAHDALTDTPIPSFFRELDARFPGSKFILTVRDRDGWLQSCRKQFNERSAAAQSEAHRRLFEDLYGTNVFDEERFVRGYERFVAGVHDYFKDRSGDLLVLDVAAGEGWEKLCPFLGRPTPDTPFPKANVTQIRWLDIRDLVAIAEAGGRELLKHYSGVVAPVVREHGAGGGIGAASLLRRALQLAGGGGTPDVAAGACRKAIAEGLRKRTPDVPLLSPEVDVAPYSERRRWNHLWLADPLDGRDAFAAGRSSFTVNLALVEDGMPIYGVVHAPALGVTYYGRVGKGAFRRRIGGDAEGIADGTTRDPKPTLEGLDVAGPGGSHALSICMQLESGAGGKAVFDEAAPWQVAAAHAIVNATGRWLLVGMAGDDLGYNTETLRCVPQRLMPHAAAG